MRFAKPSTAIFCTAILYGCQGVAVATYDGPVCNDCSPQEYLALPEPGRIKSVRGFIDIGKRINDPIAYRCFRSGNPYTVQPRFDRYISDSPSLVSSASKAVHIYVAFINECAALGDYKIRSMPK